MDVRSLQARHPLCDVETFRRYDALYRGGQTFRSMVAEFLPRQPQDTQAIYQLRLKEAAYRPYVGQIVRAYAGTLFASHYAIRAKVDGKPVELNAVYAGLKEDCDGQGTDLTNFFKDRFRCALVNCASFWVVEMPRGTAEDAGMTEDEWTAQGRDRARLRALDTCNVLDWEAGDDGGFAWVKVHDRAMRRADPASPVMVVDTWRVYWPDHVDVFRLEYPQNKKPRPTTQVPLVESYEHGFSRVPILSLRLPDGMWLLDSAADAQVEHFRLSAALGWSLRRCAYPIAVLKLRQGADEVPPMGPGLGIRLDTEESFEWAEPSGAALVVLRDEIKSKKDEIYRVSQQMAMSVDNSSAALGRSGLSKMQDAAAADACLRDYAQVVREAIESTMEFVSNAHEDYDTTFHVDGFDSFSTADVEAIVDAAKAASELGIEDASETYRVEVYTRVAHALLPADARQDVKDAIRKEIKRSARATKRAKAAPGFPGSAQPNGESRATPGGTPAPGSED